MSGPIKKQGNELDPRQVNQLAVLTGQKAAHISKTMNEVKKVRFEPVRFNSNAIEVGTNSNQILGRNDYRRFLAFQNQGAFPIYISFGRMAENNANALLIPAGGYFSIETGVVPNNEIYAISTAQAVICVIEGSAF